MYGCRGQALSASHVWLLQLHRCTNVACRNLSSRVTVHMKLHIHIHSQRFFVDIYGYICQIVDIYRVGQKTDRYHIKSE